MCRCRELTRHPLFRGVSAIEILGGKNAEPNRQILITCDNYYLSIK